MHEDFYALRMTKTLFFPLLVVSAIAVTMFHGMAKERPAEKDLREYARGINTANQWRGKVAPDAEFVTLTGESFRLREHVGRETVILNFFATWCGPCRAEMPELNRFLREHQDERVTFLGVDAAERRDVVGRFLEDVPVSFPIAIDDGQVQKAYGISAFPTTVVIGADGRIQLYEVGAIMNADIALAPLVAGNRALFDAGKGITGDAYVRLAALEHDTAGREEPTDGQTLVGRAHDIAVKMPCPCGCADKVSACSCSTSRKIKARLREGRFADQTDAEIMTALNAEFCMKAM